MASAISSLPDFPRSTFASLVEPPKTFYSPVGLKPTKDNDSVTGKRSEGEDSITKLTLADFVLLGRRLSESDVISLTFLLLNDPGEAFKVCKDIEAGNLPANVPAGPWLMAALFEVRR